jgi:hypothetical protein
MARHVISVQHEPVYRNNRMVGYYTHTYFVDKLDLPTTHQAPAPRPSTPPPRQPPASPVVAQGAPPRVVTMTGQQFSRLCVEATMVGVPPQPDVHGEVLRREEARLQRKET